MSNDEPCVRVKSNRTMLFAFAAFMISWSSWLSISYINIRLDSSVQFAAIDTKLLQIQADLIQIKADNDSRSNTILDYITSESRHRTD